MADNVELDPGSGGAVIATDDAGAAGHVQINKLAIATDGSATLIPADAANGLDVDVTRLPALPTGANTIGTVEIGATSLAALESVTVVDGGATLSVDDGAGSLTVDGTVTANAGTGPFPVSDNGGSLTVDGTVAVSGTVAVTDNAGSLTVDNAGTFVTQENGGALTALQLIDNTIFVDDAAFTVGTSSVSVAGFIADQASTDSVNEGDAGAARMTLDRKQVVTVAPSADTEGLSVANNIDIDESEDAVKASAGKLYGWYLYNDGAAEVYVKFYNDTVANVIVGTTAPHMTIPVPAGAAANVEFTNGIAFSAAITVAATTGVATADTGAPAANQVVGCILYQ